MGELSVREVRQVLLLLLLMLNKGEKEEGPKDVLVLLLALLLLEDEVYKKAGRGEEIPRSAFARQSSRSS